MVRIESIEIAGYKSIRSATIPLGALNVLIGANGSGKSNLLGEIDLDDAPSFADDNAATVRAFWEQAAPELGLDAQLSPRR
jgi:predicted ATP-dependent endonuclease of OLD family